MATYQLHYLGGVSSNEPHTTLCEAAAAAYRIVRGRLHRKFVVQIRDDSGKVVGRVSKAKGLISYVAEA